MLFLKRMSHHDKELESGVFIGNQVDKSDLRNPISRYLVNGFDAAIHSALDALEPEAVHEVGCGEGRLSRMIVERYGIDVLATDFSEAIISENDKGNVDPKIRYEQASAYELRKETHHRDVVICCEVLEHLEEPQRGLRSLYDLDARGYVFSVPNEPIWRILNMVRGKYWSDWGNTPGHLNHWSYSSFEELLNRSGFRVDRSLNPFPWLMVLARRET